MKTTISTKEALSFHALIIVGASVGALFGFFPFIALYLAFNLALYAYSLYSQNKSEKPVKVVSEPVTA